MESIKVIMPKDYCNGAEDCKNPIDVPCIHCDANYCIEHAHYCAGCKGCVCLNQSKKCRKCVYNFCIDKCFNNHLQFCR